MEVWFSGFVVSLIGVGLCLAGSPCCGEEVVKNGFVFVRSDAGTITSLRFDAKGRGNHGMETVAPGGSIRGIESVSLSGNVLTLRPTKDGIAWDMPFLKAGFYDADAHVNYPHDTDMTDAIPLVLPFESFTGSSGHYLRIEHFKRLPESPHWSSMNVRDGGMILMRSDGSQNWDVEVLLPSKDAVEFDPRDDRLILQTGPLAGPMRIAVLPRGAREMPRNAFLMPSARFTPDTPVTYEPTGKTVPISRLMTDFMRMGTYWFHDVQVVGEWAVAADLHVTDDPRSWYLRRLRKELLDDQAWIGYDRFGHFGYQYAWERYPDYGAGDWRPWTDDLRMLHVNGIRVMALVRYVLATGDRDFLRAKRARTVYTDGDEKQPICGAGADMMDYVLAAGDISPDGRSFSEKHSLGQEFTSTTPFSTVSVLLGNPSSTTPNHGKLGLYDRYGGKLIAMMPVSLPPNTSQQVSHAVGRQLPPGKYYLELTDDDSGKVYFGPGLTWWTNVDSGYTGGDAYNGPIHGDVLANINILFDYMREHMGAAKENIAYYQNDPEYNYGDFKSGRHLKCAPNCYWEGAGGGYDAYVAIWYNAACSSMADLYAFLGDGRKARHYRSLKKLADEAYRGVFWRIVTDNGRTFSRFHGCKDWDGSIHDFGFSYYNLEAAARQIPTPEQTRSILWWLDRGQYSPDGGKTWHDHPYSVWELFPPSNMIENSVWLQFCGTLPWLQVLTNGCSRLDCTARDLQVRARYLSIDNMHERNERVLARFASPDRLTGGRTRKEHWLDRWFFLGPNTQLGDIEGFREIFPQGGIVASYQPAYYLGMEYAPGGLSLRPKVPSAYESVEFANIGYRGCVFTFKAEAERRVVVEDKVGPLVPLRRGGEIRRAFRAPSRFSKIGVRVAVKPFKTTSYNGLSIVLEKRSGNRWVNVAENWYNHLKDAQWVWVDADRYLPKNGEYRVRLSNADPAPGETVLVHTRAGASRVTGRRSDVEIALRLVDERTKLTVETVHNPGNSGFALVGVSSTTRPNVREGGLGTVTTVVEPGQKLWLQVRVSRTNCQRNSSGMMSTTSP